MRAVEIKGGQPRQASQMSESCTTDAAAAKRQLAQPGQSGQMRESRVRHVCSGEVERPQVEQPSKGDEAAVRHADTEVEPGQAVKRPLPCQDAERFVVTRQHLQLHHPPPLSLPPVACRDDSKGRSRCLDGQQTTLEPDVDTSEGSVLPGLCVVAQQCKFAANRLLPHGAPGLGQFALDADKVATWIAAL